jgi:hypothetical protein
VTNSLNKIWSFYEKFLSIWTIRHPFAFVIFRKSDKNMQTSESLAENIILSLRLSISGLNWHKIDKIFVHYLFVEKLLIAISNNCLDSGGVQIYYLSLFQFDHENLKISGQR